MMQAALLCLMLMLAGCSVQAGRYQASTNAAGNTFWRLDTWTGELEVCGFETGKPTCHAFPAPAPKK
jgi:hypothetical protein